MRGTPTRAPYSPWASRPGEVEPSRKVLVSWSESNDRATHTRAPFFHLTGFRERPARTLFTAARQRGSSQVQAGSPAPFPEVWCAAGRAGARLTTEAPDRRRMVSSSRTGSADDSAGGRPAQREPSLQSQQSVRASERL
jgi:hypothetical protein